MEEVLDDDDDDEVKVEKSNVEKMEKHRDPESRVLEARPAGIIHLFWTFQIHCCFHYQPCIKTKVKHPLYLVHNCSFFKYLMTEFRQTRQAKQAQAKTKMQGSARRRHIKLLWGICVLEKKKFVCLFLT